MGPENKNPNNGASVAQQQNRASSVFGNNRAGMRVSNFGGSYVQANNNASNDYNVQKKSNKKFFLIAIIIAIVVVIGVIIAIVLNNSSSSNENLSYDKATEIFSNEKIIKVEQFEVFYNGVIDGAQNLGNLLSEDAREQLVDGFDGYKQFYDEIKNYSSITKKDGELVSLEDLRAKMSAMIEISEPIVAEYKNLYESFKKNRNGEIVILGLKDSDIQNKSGIISDKKMNDLVLSFLKNITRQNELTTEYRNRCKTFRTAECEQMEAEFDALGEKIFSKQAISDYFKNHKDNAFFQNNKVAINILEIKTALR